MTNGELEQRIVKYALDQGIGIVYAPDTDDVYTTEAEAKAAAVTGRRQRFVDADTIALFIEHPYRDQVIYAIDNQMSMLDFEGWQKLQEALGIELEWNTARKINSILYDSEVSIFELKRPQYENLDIEVNFSSLETLCKTVFGVKLDPVSRKDLDYALRLVGIDLLTLMQSRCINKVSHVSATDHFK